MGPTLPLIQCVLERQADCSSISGADVKNEWSFTAIPSCVFMILERMAG